MAPPFAKFIEAIEAIVRSGGSAADIVAAIEPRLHDLVTDSTWLEDRFRRPILEKAYAQYLLYRPDDFAFSVVSFVWNPQKGSPVHDHCTWGVIGQYVGVEEEARFRLLPGGGLEKVATVFVNPGQVSHVFPPNRDIHQIVNRSSTPTISIHVYGGDIGSQPRYVYDPNTGARTSFVSGYDPI